MTELYPLNELFQTRELFRATTDDSAKKFRC